MAPIVRPANTVWQTARSGEQGGSEARRGVHGRPRAKNAGGRAASRQEPGPKTPNVLEGHRIDGCRHRRRTLGVSEAEDLGGSLLGAG